MRLLLAAAVLALSACSEPPAESPPAAPEGAADAPALPAPPAPPAHPALAPVEGWETSAAMRADIPASAPEFLGRLPNGDTVTRDSLRDRWTILGFDTEATITPEETTYLAALDSAVKQDPDLDFLYVYRLPEDATRAPPMKWPALIDVGPISNAFGITQAPTYLLVGPDLTIEAWRGALSATPSDGVKPVFRGVAEIRKQISAPR